MSKETLFKLRRSDIIHIIIGIFYIGSFIWGIATVKAQVDTNTTWITRYENLPACVENIEKWINKNQQLPDDVLTLKIDIKYLSKGIDKLTSQLEIANKNFMKFNGERIDK